MTPNKITKQTNQDLAVFWILVTGRKILSTVALMYLTMLPESATLVFPAIYHQFKTPLQTSSVKFYVVMKLTYPSTAISLPVI